MSRVFAAAADWLLALLPGAFIVAFAFSSGGFLPGPVALAAVVLTVLLVVRLTLPRPVRSSLSVGYVAGAAALALLACWALISSRWSDSVARAVTEYDRALLYLLGFVLLGSLGRTPERLRRTMRGIAAAAFAVSLSGFVTRVAPDVWSVHPTPPVDCLAYPLGYCNALGLLAAIGIVLCLAITSDDCEPRVARVLAAGALPVLAAALLLTFSRGAIAAGAIGVLALLVAGRPRALLSGLLASLPAVAVSVVSAYGAELVASADPTSAAATAQGHDVALVVALCALHAAAVRAALLALDRRTPAWRLPGALRLPAARWGVAAAVAVVTVTLLLSAGTWRAVERQYARFVDSDVVERTQGSDTRDRLISPHNDGRLVYWRVALETFERNRLRGQGAGTFALAWDHERPVTYPIEDAHSLYAEVLAELGIVGLLLVVAAVLLVLGGFLTCSRGAERVVGGALFGAGVTWALRAGVDWDWEMPAVTFWFFAAGGLALAAPAVQRARAATAAAAEPERRAVGRVLAALACLLLAVLPARVYLSEGPLRASARAFARGDCATAIDRALESSAALGARPEPFIVLGYCDVRVGRLDLAARAMRHAVDKDPHNWEGHYGLALARAAAGRDPRLHLREAQRLSPREPLLDETRRLLGHHRRDWTRRTLQAQLPAR